MFALRSLAALLVAATMASAAAVPGACSPLPPASSSASAPPAASTDKATSTDKAPASGTVSLTGVTHSVVAGLGGLHFDPDNVVANIGDIVEVLYLPKNHSFAQSSFQEPCKPLAGGFFSGFNFATANGLAPDVFQIVVESTQPVWYYCPQTNGNHCQAGMAGVINQNFNSPNTLDAYKKAAALTGVSVVPPTVQGGSIIANPNPGSGF